MHIRVSLFIDADPALARPAKAVGADRIELYTGPFGSKLTARERAAELGRLKAAAEAARQAGLGVNAGHDLTRDNLPELAAAIPFLAEVSIGHAIAADAFTFGMAADRAAVPRRSGSPGSSSFGMTGELLTLAGIGLVQLLAVISPGPSFLITAQTAALRSPATGVKVALGLGAGTLLWSGAALLGLNAIFQQFHWLYMAVKTGGALFLLWIAWQIFRHAAEPVKLENGQAEGRAGVPFLTGFLTQIGNPKVAVFFGSIFVAMLPREVPLWMGLALIAIVTFNEVWWYSAVALFFGSSPVRRRYLAAKRYIDRATGLFLGALGLRLLWSAREAA